MSDWSTRACRPKRYDLSHVVPYGLTSEYLHWGERLLKRITEACEPRAKVLAGGLDYRGFAAQRDKVVQGDGAYVTYTDAARFFDLTYPTSGPKELIGFSAR